MYDISFLHTGQIHVDNFERIIKEIAPEVITHHHVDESLLIYAQRHGMDEELSSRITTVLDSLSEKSRLIVVTCSSIGQVAEQLDGLNGCIIQRIDRAMADKAAQLGGKILVLAAVESTLQPTLELLESSMERIEAISDINFHCVKDAWPHFVDGDLEQYHLKIKDGIEANSLGFDVVVLAQASMAGVCQSISSSMPILSSPRLGVERAVKALV
ncbi:hypothetical protein [Vibrio sp. SCSIO 43136]|uniref:hypothetical protein n=1 Tax=Vibrio sp. SCSIO 43136 TaxID=2819101 RepID=UPI0020758265|nr:hypothetical protein [Vibrio sp. SCSIO 43136]USD66891.1 hypothetical protein J4N39_19780 [Vibrio sp. SCSIO 43136]